MSSITDEVGHISLQEKITGMLEEKSSTNMYDRLLKLAASSVNEVRTIIIAFIQQNIFLISIMVHGRSVYYLNLNVFDCMSSGLASDLPIR